MATQATGPLLWQEGTIVLLTAKNPADLVAAVCVALGFIPTESVIVHMDWVDDTNPGPPMFRMDLDTIGHVPAQIETLARRYGPLSVSVVAIGADLATGRTATADQVRTLEATLHNLVPVQIVAATDGQMVWCACDTAGCSDFRWRVDLQSHQFTAQAAAEGHHVRTAQQVTASLTPGSTTAWAPVDAQAVSDSIDFTTGDDPRDGVDRAVKMAAREIPAQTRTDVAHLVAASMVTPIRDLMWAHITRANAADALALWSWVARNTEPAKATNALALAGFAAWQTGDGHAARIACEHAATIDPGHSMSAWSVLRSGWTPAPGPSPTSQTCRSTSRHSGRADRPTGGRHLPRGRGWRPPAQPGRCGTQLSPAPAGVARALAGTANRTRVVSHRVEARSSQSGNSAAVRFASD